MSKILLTSCTGDIGSAVLKKIVPEQNKIVVVATRSRKNEFSLSYETFYYEDISKSIDWTHVLYDVKTVLGLSTLEDLFIPCIDHPAVVN